jgi:hypothetical protein
MTMQIKLSRLKTAVVAAMVWGLSAGAGATPLTLTASGVAAGFNLTTFVSGYNFGGGYGPLALGVLPNGNIVTGSSGDQKVYVFSDVDNQTLASSISATPYACQTGNCNYAMATAGGQVYGAQAFGGVYERFNSDGTRTPIPNLQAAGLFGSLGMWANPTNGHLIASSNRGLVEIDPVAGTFRVINGGLFPDGVSVSADGSVAYVENFGTIQSYNIATGALIRTYSTGHSPDGTGVIFGGAFDGDIILNNNDGTVGLLDPDLADGDPLQFQIIASGGSRGDFVSPDLNNGTLFLSQNEKIVRLSCGPGCSIGAPNPELPEPGTLALVSIAVFGLGAGRMLRPARH